MGRYAEYTELKKDGSLSYKIKYINNTKEKKAELAYFDKDEKPTTKKTWLYNAKGELTEMLEYTKEGQLDRRYVFTYNDKGNNKVGLWTDPRPIAPWEIRRLHREGISTKDSFSIKNN